MLRKVRLGKLNEAITDYDEAIRLDPDSPEAYTNRGAAKYKLGRHEEAIVDYDEAIRLKPGFAEAYSNRGAAKWTLGQVEAAKKDFQTALELAKRQGDEKLRTTIERMIQKLKDKE